MPGIAGIVDMTGGIKLHETIQSMVTAMNHSSDFRIEFWADEKEGIALGRSDLPVFNRERQPLLDRMGNLAIVFHGEIFDVRGEKAEADKDLLHLSLEEGEDAIPELNGAFNIALWDRRTHRLTLANDRYGTYPLFTHYSNGKFLFASEIKAILHSKLVHPERNPKGIADWLSFGSVRGEKTLFQNIERFPLASILHFKRGGIEKKIYWKPRFNPSRESKKKNSWLNGLEFAFKNSVERCLMDRENVCVALTGGMDTRLIWSVIPLERIPVPSVTFGLEGSLDFQLAKRILNETGGKGVFIPIDSSFFKDFPLNAERTVYLSDGNHPISSTLDIFAYSRLKDNYSILVEGVGGEFIDRFWLKNRAPFIKTKEGLREALYASIHLPLKGLLKKDLVSYIEKSSWESLDDFLLTQNGNFRMKDIMDIFFLQEIYGYGLTHGMNVQSCFLGYRQPILDYHFVDLILKSPLEFRENGTIHHHIISKNMPQLSRIKRSYGGGIPIPFHGRNPLQYPPIFLHRASKKFRFLRSLDPSKPFVRYGDWIRGPLKNFVFEILLDSRTRNRGYFDPEAVEKLLSNHQKGVGNYWSFISFMITFELWNRLFFDAGTTSGMKISNP